MTQPDIRLEWQGLKGALHAVAATPAELDKEIYHAVLDSANIARREIRKATGGTKKVRRQVQKAIRVQLQGRGQNVVAQVKAADAGSHAKSLPGLLASMQERGVEPYAEGRGTHPGVTRIDFMGKGERSAIPLVDARLEALGSTLVRRISDRIRVDE